MTTLSQDQFDAVCDAQDTDSALADLPAGNAADELARRGHPAFKDWVVEEPEAPPEEKPAAKPAKPATKTKRRPPASERKAAAKSPARAAPPKPGGPAYPPASAGGIPELDTGKPRGDVVEVPAEAAARIAEGGVQLPAKVAEPEHQPLAKRQGGVAVEGMQALGQKDFVIPQLSLKQAQTRDDDKTGIREIPDGDWFLSNDPEDHGGRVVVFLEIRPERSYLLPYRDEDRSRALGMLGMLDVVSEETNVICASPDREAPVPREEQDWNCQAESCGECPHTQWLTGHNGRRKPPACGESYSCLLLDVTEGAQTPARLFLRSSAIKPTRSLLTNLRLAARRYGRGTAGFMVELSSRHKDTADGVYYIAKFGRPQPVSDEEYADYAAIRCALIESVQAPAAAAAAAEEGA